MRAAVISDIHANKYAFEAVIADIQNQQCKYVLVLGDLIGYYYWPVEVVETLMSRNNTYVIRGNHEDLLFKARDDAKEKNKYYRKYGSGINHCLDLLSEDQLTWLEDLPRDLELDLEGVRIGLYHGSDSSTDEYVYPDAELSRLVETSSDLDFKFFGHTHYPMMARSKDTTLANPGSVGQPRDVGSIASYMVLNLENKVLSPRRVPFDSQEIRKTAEQIDPDLSYLSDIMTRNNALC